MARFSFDKNGYTLLTRDRPRLFPYEFAKAAVERAEAAQKDAKAPYPMVRILTAEQARDWNPDALSQRAAERHSLFPTRKTLRRKFASARCVLA